MALTALELGTPIAIGYLRSDISGSTRVYDEASSSARSSCGSSPFRGGDFAHFDRVAVQSGQYSMKSG